MHVAVCYATVTVIAIAIAILFLVTTNAENACVFSAGLQSALNDVQLTFVLHHCIDQTCRNCTCEDGALVYQNLGAAQPKVIGSISKIISWICIHMCIHVSFGSTATAFPSTHAILLQCATSLAAQQHQPNRRQSACSWHPFIDL